MIFTGQTLNANVRGTLLVVWVGLLGILVLNFMELSGLAINHVHVSGMLIIDVIK